MARPALCLGAGDARGTSISADIGATGRHGGQSGGRVRTVPRKPAEAASQLRATCPTRLQVRALKEADAQE